MTHKPKVTDPIVILNDDAHSLLVIAAVDHMNDKSIPKYVRGAYRALAGMLSRASLIALERDPKYSKWTNTPKRVAFKPKARDASRTRAGKGARRRKSK